MELREFIEARLADDQRIAEDAYALDDGWPFWVDVDDEHHYRAACTFRERLGPARVLRDVESKRGLLADIMAAEHRLIDEWWSCEKVDFAHWNATDPGEVRLTNAACTCGRDDELERRLRFLAAPFSDHPNYNPLWSTESVAGDS